MNRKQSSAESPTKVASAFTLVELLVVIGIISLLIAMLMPALAQVQSKANSLSCKSNMHQVGMLMQLYSDANNGVMFPVGAVDPHTGLFLTLGNQSPWIDSTGTYHNGGAGGDWTFVSLAPPAWVDPTGTAQSGAAFPPGIPVNLRWPAVLFEGVWNPPLLTCPEDDPGILEQLGEQHSYILNHHLEESPTKMVRMGPRVIANEGTPSETPLSASDVVVMGEKTQEKGDYYMEIGDFTTTPPTVDLYKHGVLLGSNYLYMDWHVSTEPPQAVETSLDPWDATGQDLSQSSQ